MCVTSKTDWEGAEEPKNTPAESGTIARGEDGGGRRRESLPKVFCANELVMILVVVCVLLLVA